MAKTNTKEEMGHRNGVCEGREEQSRVVVKQPEAWAALLWSWGCRDGLLSSLTCAWLSCLALEPWGRAWGPQTTATSIYCIQILQLLSHPPQGD